MYGMKRILFVMSSLYNGGAEKSLVNLLNEIDYSRYEVDLLLFKPKGLFMSQVPKEVHILPRPKRLKALYDDDIRFCFGSFVKVLGTAIANLCDKRYNYRKGIRWKYFYKFYLRDFEKEYDIAFAAINSDVLYYIGDKVHATKKIIMVHTDYRSSEFPKIYDFKYFKEADCIGSISNKCVDILKEVYPEFPEKFRLLENITSSKLIRKRADEFIPDEYDTDVIRILSVGRLSEEKGFDLAISAAKIMKTKGTIFKWYIIGDGIEKERLRMQIEAEDLKNDVLLLGVRENPYPYMKNCNIVVQPSRFEGKSVVLDEAKILGKPIVATCYPTVKDQLSVDEGMVVDMEPGALAEGIIRMSDPIIQQPYVAFLKQHEYGNQEVIQKYYDVFDNE